MISGADAFKEQYNEDDVKAFSNYLEAQLAKITDVPQKDEAFLREQILTMYANPVVNYIIAR